jgi:hypothetical protein
MAPACEVTIRGNAQVAHAAARAARSGVMQELCPGGSALKKYPHVRFPGLSGTVVRLPNGPTGPQLS